MSEAAQAGAVAVTGGKQSSTFRSTAKSARSLFQGIQDSAASGEAKDPVEEHTKSTAQNTKDTLEVLKEVPGQIAEKVQDFFGLGP